MKHGLFFLLVLMLPAGLMAQGNQPWKGYFSYMAIADLSQGPAQFIAGAENALFSQNTNMGIVTTTTTIDGLSGQTISAIHYSPSLNKTLIGYSNGLMTVVNQADGTITKVVDIINKQLPPNIKAVNSFTEVDGIVYVSCDFGICQYNLQTQQFGDTYYIGQGTAEIAISQTCLFNGFLYAATETQGIKRAAIDNPNLIDANQWAQVETGSWSGIQTLGSQVVAITPTGQLFRYTGSGAFQSFSQQAAPMDFRVVDNLLLVTTAAKTVIYSESLAVGVQVNASSLGVTGLNLSCATIVGSQLYLGTKANGVFTTSLTAPGTFTDMTPAGPLQNGIFSVNTESADLWMVYGGYPSNFSPVGRKLGISKYNSEGWMHIPYENVHASGKEASDLVRITFNPSNLSQFYVSSYGKGLLKFENETLVEQYDETNTNNGLESPFFPGAPDFRTVKIEQTAFDSQGNLWMTNADVQEGVKELKANGTWQSYDPGFSQFMEGNYSRMIIDSQGTKWFASFLHGVVGFSENGPTIKTIEATEDTGNLPGNQVRALALDKRGQLWIGTNLGLGVLSSTAAFSSEDQMTANPIIILDDDGVAQELLYQQYITDIAVDGANNKWIGTLDSGVFLLSPNGQQTLYHFTTENSPLPDNAIADIEVDGQTGEVFIATLKGLVSFNGIATDSSKDLSQVKVYPNPVRPGFDGTVKITNLVDNCNIKITDISGNLVYETIAEGGTIEWDTTAFGKYRVASGVYMIFIATDDGTETKVKKVMVVR